MAVDRKCLYLLHLIGCERHMVRSQRLPIPRQQHRLGTLSTWLVFVEYGGVPDLTSFVLLNGEGLNQTVLQGRPQSDSSTICLQ